MTNTDTVLSAEELALYASDDCPLYNHHEFPLPQIGQIRSMAEELLALRSHSRASSVRVRPVRWEAPDEVSWLGHGYDACEYYISFEGGSWWMPGDSEEAEEFPTLEAAKSAAQSHFNASIQSCLVAEGVEPVGWETPAEWDLEQRAFDAANHDDVPEWAQKVVQDLWQHYCLIANHAPPEAQAQGEGA